MIEITVQSDKLTRALRAIEGRISNPRAMMEDAGRMGVFEVRRNFERARDEAGRVWQPLSPVTRALRVGGHHKPLRDTGKLKTSIRLQVRSATSVMVYTRHCSAWAHQMGATIVPKKARILARELSGGGLKSMLKTGLRGIRISRNKISGKNYVVFGRRVRIPRRQFMFLYHGARKRIADTVGDYLMKGFGKAHPEGAARA